MGDQRVRVRIQPKVPEIPEDDPFVNDLLEREKSVNRLTCMVSRIEGPCVLALDAPWGYGKTMFLDMWAKSLRLKGFPVVASFNAWETDFTNHPFLALSSELTKELKFCIETAPSPIPEPLKRVAQELIRVVPQLAGELVPIGGGAMESVLAALFAAASKKADTNEKADTNDYLDVKADIASFKKKLAELAQGLSKPLVFMIDELDRCRPSYAVELLEVAKHFFAVDNVVFVLAVNRDELAHSVKALYGSGFDADVYLRRFFDLDFQLPKPGREQFVQGLLNTTKLTSILVDGEAPRVLLETFLGSPKHSLRDVQQAVHRLGLVLTLLPKGVTSLLYAVIAIVLRTANFSVYQRFVSGSATDKEVVDAVFGQRGVAALRSDGRGYGWWLESEIILGILAMRAQPADFGQSVPADGASPLLDQYRLLSQEATVQADDVQHAKAVAGRVDAQWSVRNFDLMEKSQAFIEAAKQLELLFPELGDDGNA